MKDRQNLSPERTAELVDLARTGDQDAYTALYEATSQEIYRTVRSMVRSEETALDVQQDAYVYAFTHLDQLKDPAKFRAWLRQIAVNRTRSVLRKQTPVLFTELESDEGAGLPEVADLSPEASPELRLERQETANYVQEILSDLSDGQQMLVGMYYYEQLPVGKIAEDLGVTPGTVKTQLYRSRKKIEAAVRRLEEKGVKLFGLAPMPFLMALLKKLSPAAEQSKTVLTGSLSGAGVAPVAEAAAVHVGRAFFQTALGRVVLGLITVLAVVGGVLGSNWVKNNLMKPMGDVQPPVTCDSEEDLSSEPSEDTEPTEDTEAPATFDSAEDPVPESTEPEESTEPTEPESTTGPTALAPQPTDPAAPRPTNPAPQPTNPAPQPTNPVPQATDPGGPDPAEPTEPSEMPPESSEVLGWRWDPNSNDSDPNIGSTWEVELPFYLRNVRGIKVSARGNAVPVIRSDRPDVIKVDYWGVYQGETTDYVRPEGVTEYKWTLMPCGPGTAHIYCELNGKIAYSTTVVVPEAGFLSLQTNITQELRPGEMWRGLRDCITGATYKVSVTVQGTVTLEIVTDHPEVVELTPLNTDTGNGWPTVVYSLDVNIVGPGDANLFVKVNGEIQETYQIHATCDDSEYAESSEDLHP